MKFQLWMLLLCQIEKMYFRTHFSWLSLETCCHGRHHILSSYSHVASLICKTSLAPLGILSFQTLGHGTEAKKIVAVIFLCPFISWLIFLLANFFQFAFVSAPPPTSLCYDFKWIAFLEHSPPFFPLLSEAQETQLALGSYFTCFFLPVINLGAKSL